MSMYWPVILASSGFGIQVGQYTGAWIRFASCCQPCDQAAGQPPAAGVAVGTTTTSAAAATTPTRAALMPTGYRRFWRRSDLGLRAADERRQVARADDHRVAAGVFQLLHVLRCDERQIGDRELAGGNGREQLEHHLERSALVVGLGR